jgi:aromatic-L-amino-acid decarboxylase
MDPELFRQHAHEVVDWIADYMVGVDRYPVRAQVRPGEIRSRLPAEPPLTGEPMERILTDFRETILPGVTHWNHPRFFAYFPANNSGPSILGEMLSAALGINAMLWETCPAATELEELVMDWLRQLIGLPETFRGAIQDTASTATLLALVCARERATGHAVNAQGFGAGAAGGALRVYTSAEGHSSVEKGAKIAGFGAENVVRVGVDDRLAMDAGDLAARIAADRERGLRPCAVVATVGTTSSTAVDPVPAIAEVCAREALWLHVDAALAGSAAILPEKRWLVEGCDRADSFVFNPHKWLFTNFDCSAWFTRDPQTLVSAMSILPEYLRTRWDETATNYRDWSIQLGRRFRALKLWFVLRHYGVEGLRAKLREHIALAEEFAGWVDAEPDWELLAPVTVNTVCFRWRPGGAAAAGGGLDWDAADAEEDGTPDEERLAGLNKALMDELNAAGRIYLTHTTLRGRFTLRLAVGQALTRREHVAEAWECLRSARVVRELG